MASTWPQSTRAGCSTAVTYTAAPANKPAATVVTNMGNVTLQHLRCLGNSTYPSFLVLPRVGSRGADNAFLRVHARHKFINASNSHFVTALPQTAPATKPSTAPTTNALMIKSPVRES